MKNIKFHISLICMAFMILPLYARKVAPDKAEKLAQRYMQSKRQRPTAVNVRLKHTATQRHKMRQSAQPDVMFQSAEQDTIYYYVFNVNENDGGGFVIVSGDDAVTPVLGYSDNGSYDENNLPPNFAYWMDYLQQQIAYAQTQNLPQSDAVKAEWDAYSNDAVPYATATIVVDYLIKTEWDQGFPYSNLCPLIGSVRTVTGCVATAMAQVMRYHKHPVRGSGQSVPYTTPSGIYIPSVNFEVNYDWANMPNVYYFSATQPQQDAVATLMYHCGVSVKMSYNTAANGGSGAANNAAMTAWTTHFGYDKSIRFRERKYYDDTSWENMLKTQLDAGLPVFYTGNGPEGGHAFICDGYDDGGKFHFNWGWNSWYDGWFVTTALNPGGYTFNESQTAIVNIKPDEGGESSYELALRNEFSATESSATAGESLSFSVAAGIINIGNMQFPGGSLGVALVNNDNQIVKIFGSRTIGGLSVNYYFNPVTINCNVPNDVPVGQYKLKMTIDTGGENPEIITMAYECPKELDFEIISSTLSDDASLSNLTVSA